MSCCYRPICRRRRSHGSWGFQRRVRSQGLFSGGQAARQAPFVAKPKSCLELFSFHSFFEVDFSLDDFVGWLSSYHRFSGKLLLTVRAIAESVCVILEDTLLETLQQVACPALLVVVQQCPTFGAIDLDCLDAHVALSTPAPLQINDILI